MAAPDLSRSRIKASHYRSIYILQRNSSLFIYKSHEFIYELKPLMQMDFNHHLSVFCLNMRGSWPLRKLDQHKLVWQ